LSAYTKVYDGAVNFNAYTNRPGETRCTAGNGKLDRCCLQDGHSEAHIFTVPPASTRCEAAQLGNGVWHRCVLRDGHSAWHLFEAPGGHTKIPPHADPVSKAAHYNQGKVEAIDAIEAAVTGLEGAEAFLTGQCLKYLWRWRQKGGAEDLAKCAWYLERLRTRQAAAKAVTP